MTVSPLATVLALPDAAPSVHDSAFVAAGARIVGAVTLGEHSCIWYNAVLRGDSASIVVGARSNVQDGVAIHVDAAHGVEIGEDVSIGHNAVVHGCRIGDGTLIGMGAVVLSGAVIGAGCLIAGGAVVLEGAEIPDGSLVAGVPAKVRRELTSDERAAILRNAEVYLAHSERHGSVA
ncbi:gamma carbonic anhydrase family protein [Microbacterium sp. MM2322]|uniref:gamma carbonic anhydrase family protein n=1 Tax=Microbacterium sp. MM2322 TaxID=3157631 RepID=UPI0032D590AC